MSLFTNPLRRPNIPSQPQVYARTEHNPTQSPPNQHYLERHLKPGAFRPRKASAVSYNAPVELFGWPGPIDSVTGRGARPTRKVVPKGMGRMGERSFRRSMNELCVLMGRLSLLDNEEGIKGRDKAVRQASAYIPRKRRRSARNHVNRSKLDLLITSELVDVMSHLSLDSPKIAAAVVTPPGGVGVSIEAAEDKWGKECVFVHDEGSTEGLPYQPSSRILDSWFEGSPKELNHNFHDRCVVSFASSCSSTSAEDVDNATIISTSSMSSPILAEKLPSYDSQLLAHPRTFATRIAARICSLGLRSGGPATSCGWLVTPTVCPAASTVYALQPDFCDLD